MKDQAKPYPIQHMRRRSKGIHYKTGGLLAPLLALVVALRVIAAPLVMTAPEPGMIAICAGGQIVYVSLDGAPSDADAPKPDPCPFLGITLALNEPATNVPAPHRDALGLVHPIPRIAGTPGRLQPVNPARAPPLSV